MKSSTKDVRISLKQRKLIILFSTTSELDGIIESPGAGDFQEKALFVYLEILSIFL